MVLIHTETEIKASPARVREVFLDWQKYPEWSHQFIYSIEAVSSTSQVEKGDSLKVEIKGMSLTPYIAENTGREFRWAGPGLGGLIHGSHYFKFEPSETPGWTKFSHGEDFTGAISFIMKPALGFGPKTQQNFANFNEDLKKRVESRT